MLCFKRLKKRKYTALESQRTVGFLTIPIHRNPSVIYVFFLQKDGQDFHGQLLTFLETLFFCYQSRGGQAPCQPVAESRKKKRDHHKNLKGIVLVCVRCMRINPNESESSPSTASSISIFSSWHLPISGENIFPPQGIFLHLITCTLLQQLHFFCFWALHKCNCSQNYEKLDILVEPQHNLQR